MSEFLLRAIVLAIIWIIGSVVIMWAIANSR